MNPGDLFQIRYVVPNRRHAVEGHAYLRRRLDFELPDGMFNYRWWEVEFIDQPRRRFQRLVHKDDSVNLVRPNDLIILSYDGIHADGHMQIWSRVTKVTRQWMLVQKIRGKYEDIDTTELFDKYPKVELMHDCVDPELQFYLPDPRGYAKPYGVCSRHYSCQALESQPLKEEPRYVSKT